MSAAAGEVAKDAKHLAKVEKAVDFIPFLVGCFGVWTPFALSILHSIADCTVRPPVVVSPVRRPEEIFCNNSVNNARMIFKDILGPAE